MLEEFSWYSLSGDEISDVSGNFEMDFIDFGNFKAKNVFDLSSSKRKNSIKDTLVRYKYSNKIALRCLKLL